MILRSGDGVPVGTGHALAKTGRGVGLAGYTTIVLKGGSG